MPDVTASIDFLADLELYQNEKPYAALVPPGTNVSEDELNNLEWTRHSDIRISDIRGIESKFILDECGFQLMKNPAPSYNLKTVEEIEGYKRSTEKTLKDLLGACHVTCYEARFRENVEFKRDTFDLMDPFLIESPAQGAHIDVTGISGPEIVQRYLSAADKEAYFRQGYRFRILNTWRPLLPEIEDRPLTVCDFRHVELKDLVAADRILPDRVGEVFYLRHNPEQRWYWINHQTKDEIWVMLMYDTLASDQARFCPHVSFHNQQARPDCPPRKSVETRSIVISEL